MTTSAGKTYEANSIVAGLGQLNRPLWPTIEGRVSFAGPSFHSARWDHLVKRVAIVGSAASVVQIIPEIARDVAHLTVFQRTLNWVVPRLDRPITEEEKAVAMTVPYVAMMARDMVYQNADHCFWQAFSWPKEGRAANTRVALNHLEEQVNDPGLRKKLMADYPIGCKRILYTDDCYPALMRPNVALETGAIARITPKGIETQDVELHDFDVIVYATGFETTGWHWSVDVSGKGGRRLSDEWAEIPPAYLGISHTRRRRCDGEGEVGRLCGSRGRVVHALAVSGTKPSRVATGPRNRVDRC